MLSTKAQQVLHDYFNLPFPGVPGVRCPYYNNARLKRRGQLRALIGKGSPEEIVEETKILSLHYRAGLFNQAGSCCLHGSHQHNDTDKDNIRKFLIDHTLGVDCSGFVTHILLTHYAEIKNINLIHKIYIAPKNIWHWLVCKSRPIENLGVRVYADRHNSRELTTISEADTGDLIVMLNTGPQHNRNHTLLVTERQGEIIHYVASRAWSSEGQYGHGVAAGQIKIINPQGNLLAQEWTELDVTGEANKTLLEAKMAQSLSLRRLNF